MVVGIAVGVFAATLVAVLPTVLEAREAVVAARLPALVPDGAEPRLTFTQTDDVWRGQRLGRTFVADVRPGSPTPPGVNRLPAPGEAIVAPALARLLRNDPELARLVPGRVVGTIAEEGLLGPDELYAYIGLPADRIRDPRQAVGFGSSDRFALESQQAGLPQALGMLVMPPVLIYLLVCGRLAAATRSRRYAALRLLGLRRSQTLRIAALEAMVAGAVGAVLGVALVALALPSIANAGLLGFSWYPGMAGITTTMLVAIVLSVAMASAFLGAIGLRRSLSQALATRADVAESPPRWWLGLPLMGGLGILVGTFVVLPHGAATPDGQRVAIDDQLGWTIVTGIGLALIGVLVGLRPIVGALAYLLTRRPWRYPVRLAGRRLASEPAGTLRLLAGLALLVLMAGLGAGVLRDLSLRAGPGARHYEVWVEGAQAATPAVQQRIFDLAEHRYTFQPSIVESVGPGGPPPSTVAEQVRFTGVQLVTVDCVNLAMFVPGLAGCQPDTTYRLVSRQQADGGNQLPPGTVVTYRGADGDENEIAVPGATVIVPDDGILPAGSFGSLLRTTSGPAFGWSPDVWTAAFLPPDPAALEAFKAAAAQISPTTRLQVIGENLQMLEQYRNQSGVLTAGIRLGFLLGALAFLIAYVDRMLERRREVAALLVLGMRRRTIRAVQAVQLLAPLAIVLTLAVVVGHLAGNAALRLNHVGLPWFTGTISAMVPLVAVAVVAALAAAGILAVRTLRSDDLRRE